MATKKSKLIPQTKNPSLKHEIDNTSLGTIIITAPDSSVLYATNNIQEKTGFAPSEVIGKKPKQLWGGTMDKSFYKDMWQTIGQQKKPFIGSVKNHKKDGSTYTDLLHIAPILDTAGNIKFFIEINPNSSASSSAEPDFTHNFMSHFNKRKINDKTVINFFLRLFSLPGAAGKNNSLETLLQQTLVNPTNTQYHNRLEDSELIHSAQSNNLYFDKLYQKYFLNVKQYFFTRADPAFAEDLAQETFLQAFKYLPRFTVSNASYLTYLLRIAHNILVGHYRLATHNPTTQDMTWLENIPATPVDQAKIWDMDKLWEAVRAMPETEQKILTMKYRQDRLIKDIARTVGKSENAVKLVLSRARKKLRSTLVRPE